jgi:hypothetical protein
MKVRKWLISALGAFIVIFVSDMLIHGVWLNEFYRVHSAWWLPVGQMQARIGFMVAGEMALALLMVLIYRQGHEAGKDNLFQGLRFGFLIGLLINLPSSLMLYDIYPYPASLLVAWFVGGVAELTFAGGVIGLLYKPAK